MKKREPVSHIMTRSVLSVNLNNSLQDAEDLMVQNHIRHVPVVSGESLIGILSLTDLMRISYVEGFESSSEKARSAVYSMLSIDQVMHNKPHTVSSSDTIKEVAEILGKKEFHALPVVDDGKLVGIVTSTDLINYLIDQY